MRVPSLGPRGEGWVAGQVAILLGIAITGALALGTPHGAGTIRLLGVVAGLTLIALGGSVVAGAFRSLGPNLTAVPMPRPDGQLVQHGPYRWVRHPIYAGIIAGSGGWAFVTGSAWTWALTILLVAWFDLKARREEAWLAARYPAYPAYAAQTRRFVPWLY